MKDRAIISLPFHLIVKFLQFCVLNCMMVIDEGNLLF